MRRIEARLQTVATEGRSLSDYYGVAPDDQLERAAALAEPLAGLRVLYVSGAPREAADPAPALVALLRDLGLEAERMVLHGDRAFQLAGLELSDALRGAAWQGGEEEWRRLREACEAAAIAVDPRRFDAVVVHGAAAAPLIEGRRSGSTGWLWRTGLDLGRPAADAWSLFCALLGGYSATSFALPQYVPPGIGGARVRVIPGAFDPLAAAQRDLSASELSSLIRGLGVDPARPLLIDLTPLDRWADPLAVIEAWREARARAGALQLAFAGRLDAGDPGAADVLAEVEAFAGDFTDLHLLAGYGPLEERQRGALVRLARCVVRVSLGEEFDPALAAALWNGTPVVAAGAAAAAQVEDGHDGFVVAGATELAQRTAELASDPAKAVAMGRAGRARAAGQFSIIRLLADETEILGSMAGRAAAEPEPSRAAA